MIANDTILHQRPSDKAVNNYVTVRRLKMSKTYTTKSSIKDSEMTACNNLNEKNKRKK